VTLPRILLCFAPKLVDLPHGDPIHVNPLTVPQDLLSTPPGPKLWLEPMGPTPVRLDITLPILLFIAPKMEDQPPGEAILVKVFIALLDLPRALPGLKLCLGPTGPLLVRLDTLLRIPLFIALKMMDQPRGEATLVKVFTALEDLLSTRLGFKHLATPLARSLAQLAITPQIPVFIALKLVTLLLGEAIPANLSIALKARRPVPSGLKPSAVSMALIHVWWAIMLPQIRLSTAFKMVDLPPGTPIPANPFRRVTNKH